MVRLDSYWTNLHMIKLLLHKSLSVAGGDHSSKCPSWRGFGAVDLCVHGHVFGVIVQSVYRNLVAQCTHGWSMLWKRYAILCAARAWNIGSFLLCQQPNMLTAIHKRLMHPFCSYVHTYTCLLWPAVYILGSNEVCTYALCMDVTESSPECTVLPPLAGCMPINQ